MEEFATALREGDEGTVLRLVDADPALLERVVDMRHRPLAMAAWNGHLGVVRLLIERGANVNATGARGRRALTYAAQRGHAEVVALLLREGANANFIRYNGATPLMLACTNGHLGVVKVLVQHMGGRGLDDGDDHGWTALHYAAEWGYEEVVRFLLFAGADATIKDNERRTPRGIVEQNAYVDRIRARRERCVTVFQVRPLTC
jgi:ankyrin repeat protein